MTSACISLGSNMGERLSNLKAAVDMVAGLETTALTAESAVYETEPWGLKDQDSFLNMCIKIETELSPKELLKKLQEIELGLGRKRLIRWGPRTIDLDILIYDDVQMDDEELTLPHPRITERAFVLMPLLEIAGDIIINGRHLSSWLEDISDQGIWMFKE
ncbi:2-amino-4-hydroxy-6-hydroxymethyldihydropteridine pyrophosphokinase FolK [Peptoclostridium acidaminophilum DSM 3953]|uniref:2-amino-4-hydroxy-6-hydroxymethyldihydropteridine diphosphokinase n=1 Tax=Peptoclostridium acidaminophilum DSM 3953 TaxID=1286171 RepID=W8U7Z5_PEPAC|nr:2-amino-4-hydroxy-6-hydroxymethyldihydropteridine diphosphokinase [Peptoclostridium acidaminophilum]AHM57006.1 2-amino-4-hydroxy-6-hydroxymethyldihydropteridine pyrophosphokinase FolK [Peptoclostridium acidaminophilum DSM 3953]